jgi:hypothetical protein
MQWYGSRTDKKKVVRILKFEAQGLELYFSVFSFSILSQSLQSMYGAVPLKFLAAFRNM